MEDPPARDDRLQSTGVILARETIDSLPAAAGQSL
jgi:hypothetical protein